MSLENKKPVETKNNTQNSYNVFHVTDETFESFKKQSIEKNIPMVLKFSASWCAPCKIIAPFYNELCNKNESKGVFLHVDVDESDKLTSEFNITAMPTFIGCVPSNNNLKVKQVLKGANQPSLLTMFNELFG